MKRIVAALFMLGLLSVAPAHAQQSMSGRWSGLGLQNEPTQTWDVVVTFRPDGSALIDYPSLQCGGELRSEGRRGGVSFFREHITYGPHCVNGGTVGVFPQAGKLMWFWTAENTNYPEMSASAVLSRYTPIS